MFKYHISQERYNILLEQSHIVQNALKERGDQLYSDDQFFETVGKVISDQGVLEIWMIGDKMHGYINTSWYDYDTEQKQNLFKGVDFEGDVEICVDNG